MFAGFPVVIQKYLGLKRAGLPSLTPWLGPVYRSSSGKYVTKVSNRKEINRKLARILKEDFDDIALCFSPLIRDLQPYIWEGFSTKINYTYRLNLDNLDDIWNSMDASRRRDIRRAKKDDIVVENLTNFDDTFNLVEKTYARQNKNPYFKETAYAINQALEREEKCRSFLAISSDGQPLAAVYIIWDKATAYYLLGGYDTKYSHHGAGALAMWEAIKYSSEELGLSTFDFEGSMVQHIEKYFRKFGGRITPYYSLQWKSRKRKCLFGAKALGRILRNIGII